MMMWGCPSSDNSDCCRTTPTIVGQLRPPSSSKPWGSYALMNQNTTREATETEMDHVHVISIKKGPFEPNLLISRTAPLTIS